MAAAMAVLVCVPTASAATPAPGAAPTATHAASAATTAGYDVPFRGSWTILNGSRGQRAAVRRVIRRMHFPHKQFLGRFVAIRFGGRFGADQGWAAPEKGYVLLSLFPGWNAFVVAHEIGHAADFAMLNDESGSAFDALVGRHAPRHDCLSDHVRWHNSLARDHSCRRQEEWASAFARAYCCSEPRVGIEGRRVPRRLFRSFARKHLHPADTRVTRLTKVSCYFPAKLFITRLTPQQCRAQQGMANPKLVMCTYANSEGREVTLRLELSDCQSRISRSASRRR